MRDLFFQSSALILALVLVRFFFRNTISRRVQYALWALVLLRLLLPVRLPPANFSVLSLTAPFRAAAENAVTERVEEPLRKGVEQVFRASVRGADTEANGIGIIGGADGPTQVSVMGMPLWMHLLALLRLAGSGVLGLWFLAVNLRFARKLRRTRVPLDGTGSRYPVYLCDDIPSPCLFGLLRPAIYVTSAGAKDPERLRCVLAHEETHARHGDLLWALLRGVCLVLWWFHPLVWLAAWLSRIDGELACDEGTLRRLGEEERRAYGETLLALIPVRGGGNPLLSATTMTAGRRQMQDRITRIAENRRPVLLAAVLALLLTGFACAAAFPGAGETAAEEATAAAEAPEPWDDSWLEPPALTLGEVTAYAGAYVWTVENGQSSKDGIHPLLMNGELPVLPARSGTPIPLGFSLPPEAVRAYRWSGAYRETGRALAEMVPVRSAGGGGWALDGAEDGFVYEVVADWTGGTVCYWFAVSSASAGEALSVDSAEVPGWVSTDAKDYRFTDEMLRMEAPPDFASLSLEALGAFYLSTDGAGAESGAWWLYRWFLDSPDSVLIYLDRVRGHAGGTAETRLARAIVSARDPGDGYEAVLGRCRGVYPVGGFGELLDLLAPEE